MKSESIIGEVKVILKVVNKQGKNALEIAKEKGHNHVVEYLSSRMK